MEDMSLETRIEELTEVIKDLKVKLSIDQEVSNEMKLLKANNMKMFTALEKIEDPRKMDHKERDTQTTIYCLQNVAHTTLEEVRGSGQRE